GQGAATAAAPARARWTARAARLRGASCERNSAADAGANVAVAHARVRAARVGTARARLVGTAVRTENAPGEPTRGGSEIRPRQLPQDFLIKLQRLQLLLHGYGPLRNVGPCGTNSVASHARARSRAHPIKVHLSCD